MILNKNARAIFGHLDRWFSNGYSKVMLAGQALNDIERGRTPKDYDFFVHQTASVENMVKLLEKDDNVLVLNISDKYDENNRNLIVVIDFLYLDLECQMVIIKTDTESHLEEFTDCSANQRGIFYDETVFCTEAYKKYYQTGVAVIDPDLCSLERRTKLMTRHEKFRIQSRKDATFPL